MQFFTDVHGNHYPVSRIRRMTPSKRDEKTGWKPPALIELDRDVDVRVDAYVVDRLMECGEPVFPARAGFDHLTFWYNADRPQDEPWVSILPVIGWRDTAEAGIVAVTVEDREFIRAPQAIRLPNGEVIEDDARWDTLADWRDGKKAEADQEHARNVARAAAKAAAEDAP